LSVGNTSINLKNEDTPMLDCLFSYAVFKTGVRTSLYFYKRAASFKNGWVYVLKHSLLFAPVQGVGNNISKSQIGLHTCT